MTWSGDVCWTQRRCKTNSCSVALIFSAAALQTVIAFLKSSATVQPATRRNFQENLKFRKWREFLSQKVYFLKSAEFEKTVRVVHGNGVIHVIAYAISRTLSSSSLKHLRPAPSQRGRVGRQQTRSISTVFRVTSVFGRDRQSQFCQNSVLRKTENPPKIRMPKTFPRKKFEMRDFRWFLHFFWFLSKRFSKRIC